MIKKHNSDAEDAEFLRANKHIEKREFTKAERALRRGLARAEHEKDPDGIGFYYQALGFLYLLQKKNSEALHFYQKADNASPDHHARLAYARLLTTIFADHDTGLQKAKDALKQMPKDDRAAAQAHSIIGLCYLGRGDRENAIRAFAKSLTGYSLRLTPSASYDLTLASELIRQGVFDKRCVRYLGDVRKKAGAEGNERLIQVVDRLLADAKQLEQTSI